MAYIAALSAVVMVALAELAYLFERGAAQPVFDSFVDAVLWSVAVVVAGQGNPVPSSLVAHIAMLAGFAWGVGVFATVAGALVFFIDERRERAEREPQPDVGGQ